MIPEYNTIQREIEITKLYQSMIKDTKDQLEEYFRINNYSYSERIHCLRCFMNDLKSEIEKGVNNDKTNDGANNH